MITTTDHKNDALSPKGESVGGKHDGTDHGGVDDDDAARDDADSKIPNNSNLQGRLQQMQIWYSCSCYCHCLDYCSRYSYKQFGGAGRYPDKALTARSRPAGVEAHIHAEDCSFVGDNLVGDSLVVVEDIRFGDKLVDRVVGRIDCLLQSFGLALDTWEQPVPVGNDHQDIEVG
eukprot:CAMPEP_0195523658 /NCGR_PEP_ID=MMETSP0794_2-20130614/22991_1 /TAXON_ID=515487 /ORGANISM="Stephanopyxis turris, Strain CCMP 815" /LENGTH=173 /DNA_ID=CAMNT_0040653703 /DNA_START=236 /DNA_END=753 /DNA_ORIENTATION=+